jgi:hypothetical protein
MNDISVLLLDKSGRNELAPDLRVRMTGVPSRGDLLNLFELMPSDIHELGWTFVVEDVEWVYQEESGVYGPSLHIRRSKPTQSEQAVSGNADHVE